MNDYRGATSAERLGGQPGQTISPDSMTGVVGQTQNHLSEIEGRLTKLLAKIDSSPRPPEQLGKASIEPSGLLTAANLVRNTASRIIDLVSQLENTI